MALPADDASKTTTHQKPFHINNRLRRRWQTCASDGINAGSKATATYATLTRPSTGEESQGDENTSQLSTRLLRQPLQNPPHPSGAERTRPPQLYTHFTRACTASGVLTRACTVCKTRWAGSSSPPRRKSYPVPDGQRVTD